MGKSKFYARKKNQKKFEFQKWKEILKREKTI